MNDRVLHVRGEARHDVEAALGIRLAGALGPAGLVVRTVLREHRHHHGAVVGERRIDRRRHLHLNVRRLGGHAPRGVLPSPLEIIDRRAERDTGVKEQLLLLVAYADVTRQLGQDAVDLHGAPARAIAAQQHRG